MDVQKETGTTGRKLKTSIFSAMVVGTRSTVQPDLGTLAMIFKNKTPAFKNKLLPFFLEVPGSLEQLEHTRYTTAKIYSLLVEIID